MDVHCEGALRAYQGHVGGALRACLGCIEGIKGDALEGTLRACPRELLRALRARWC